MLSKKDKDLILKLFNEFSKITNELKYQKQQISELRDKKSSLSSKEKLDTPSIIEIDLSFDVKKYNKLYFFKELKLLIDKYGIQKGIIKIEN